MPLLLKQQAEPGTLERGDELELPGLPEALVPGHPLTARNLTRGTHLTLGHDLSAREIAVLRAGGLAALRHRPRVRRGEALRCSSTRRASTSSRGRAGTAA